MDSAGNKFNYRLAVKPRLTYKELLKCNIMSCSSVMVRRDVMSCNLFASGYLHEDNAAWISIVRKYGYACGLNEPLILYRFSKGSKSRGRFNSAIMTYCVYRHVDFSVPTSLILTLRYAFHSITKHSSVRFGGLKFSEKN